MNQQKSSLQPLHRVLEAYSNVVPGVPATLIAHIYPEGNQWGVMIGHNGHDGLCGYGDTVQAALEDLADQINLLDV